jgi:hypothetical protein
MADHVLQVGAPDPGRTTSPILGEYEEISLGMEIEAGVSCINDSAYAIGAYALSDSELLHCEERGVWVRKGEMHQGAPEQ